jgi:phosphatidylglycerol:prolipoprotein diacylglycerol transferase
MYLLGFAAAWGLARYRASRPGSEWDAQQVSDLIFYGALGVILGGRIGYVLFYNFNAFLEDPLMLVRIWEGGMSFHGGLIGVLLAMVVFARRFNKTFFQVTDFIAPLIPPGLFFGRIGNFINGELWGRVTDVPWAVVFPQAGNVPRHPSQLYQAFLEGLVLFAILWWFSSKPRPTMAVSGLFLLGYGTARFIVEFFRAPDPHLGFIAFGWMTMGQLLSLPMMIIGGLFMAWAYRRQET